MSRRPTKSDDVKWYVIALYICLAPFIVVVGAVVIAAGVILLPLIIFQITRANRKRREEVRRFLEELGPQALLVWHSRRGWNEFCQNNLLPALPERIIAIQDQRRRDPAYKDRRSAEKAHDVPSQARPYLLFSDGAKLQALSLNTVLQPFKSRGKPDTAVQRKVRQAILD
ncbi:MAG: hypothetical protein ACUVXJ_17565 [Phycisphaerae bacterium]